jgi:hypothetical protein
MRQLEVGDGAEMAPASGLGGAGRRQPLEPLLQRGEWRGWNTSDTGSSSSAGGRG